MRKRSKVLLTLAGLVAVLGVVGYTYRIELLLNAVEFMTERQTVGPPRAVEWASGPDAEGRPKEERPPNVVLILADDLGWNDLSFGGGGVGGGTVPTPHIDSIARDGVSFTNGYSAHSTCAPSRAAIMSGRYGTRFGFEFTPRRQA